MQTSHLAPRIQQERDDLREENTQLRERVRQQGEFIQSMREMIRDFIYTDSQSLERFHRGRR